MRLCYRTPLRLVTTALCFPLGGVGWLCLLLLSLAAEDVEGRVLDPQAEKGGALPELTVCFRRDPPFFYQLNGDGEWAGFEFDLLAGFAESEEVRMRFVDPGSFEKVLESLERGDCDVGASRITYTQEREERFDFSPGYFPVRILAVEKEGATTIRPKQLRGKTVVTIPGTTYLKAIDAIGGEIEKVWVTTSRQMFQTVLAGRADFMACDSAVVLALMDDYPGLRVTVPLSDREHFAFALPKGSKWTGPLSKFLEDFKADGRLRALLVEYFGEEGADLILADP